MVINNTGAMLFKWPLSLVTWVGYLACHFKVISVIYAQVMIHMFLAVAVMGLTDVSVGDLSLEASGPSILVLGDSHTNTSFGVQLGKALRKLENAQVNLYGSCGRWSKAYVKGYRAHCGLRKIDSEGRITWGRGCARNPCPPGSQTCRKNACRTPKVSQLLTRHRPDITVVQLGSNSIFRGSKRDGWRKVAPSVRALTRAIADSGSQCIWVSPPHGMNKNRWQMKRFTQFLKKTTKGVCTVFDSHPEVRPYLDYRLAARRSGIKKHDKMHYDMLGRVGRACVKRWAADIAKDVEVALLTNSYGQWSRVFRITQRVWSLIDLKASVKPPPAS